jgi:hypothetical protein
VVIDQHTICDCSLFRKDVHVVALFMVKLPKDGDAKRVIKLSSVSAYEVPSVRKKDEIQGELVLVFQAEMQSELQIRLYNLQPCTPMRDQEQRFREPGGSGLGNHVL